MSAPGRLRGRFLLPAFCALCVTALPLPATAWDEEPTDSTGFEAEDRADDSGGIRLDDGYEDTYRIEPPDDLDDLPDAEAFDQEPTKDFDRGTGLGEPTDTRELDDTWEETHTIGDRERTATDDTPTEPTDQVEQQMEQLMGQEGEVAPGQTPDKAAGHRPRQPQETWSWMHRYDYVGLYGSERKEGNSRFEGLYLYGYDGPAGAGEGTSGLVSILSADLPVAVEGDGIGEAYLGFGLQGGSQRVSLYGTVGGVYTRTVRAREDSDSDLSLGGEAGVNLHFGGRTMITAALREDPNDLIDEQRVRLGLHIGSAYIGVRHRLDRELSRVDLAVRF